MEYLATELVEGKLWAGSRRAVENGQYFRGLLEKGVTNVVTILPIGAPGAWPLETSFRFKPQSLRVLIMGDREEIPPQMIDSAIGAIGSPVPTLIHCNVGQNRSTAVAACWMLRHGHAAAETVLDHVMGLRAVDIGALPRVSPEMRKNVENYAEWLKEIEGLKADV